VDYARLGEILSSDDTEMHTLLLKLFWESAEEDIAKIERALKDQDIKALRDAAHGAKGAANSVAAVGLGEALTHLQGAADANEEWTVIVSNFERVRTEIASLQAYLERQGII
jgi:HPt (histidine-containing phosphotransfer) domain-containing protein